MEKFNFTVVVPNDKAAVKIEQLPDGDQPFFDQRRVNQVLEQLGLIEAPIWKYCPISGDLLPRGDYRTLAGYDNQLQVNFRTMGNAARFRNLMEIEA